MTPVTEDSTVTEGLLLSAAVDVRKIPTVSTVAHTGGLMTVPAWGPVLVNLAGLDVTGEVTTLSDHHSTRRGVVGHGRAQVTDGRLVVTGTISATGQAAREIVHAAKNGVHSQASVGVEVLGRRLVVVPHRPGTGGRGVHHPDRHRADGLEGRPRPGGAEAQGRPGRHPVRQGREGCREGPNDHNHRGRVGTACRDIPGEARRSGTTSMLHDPSHYEPRPVAEEIRLRPAERDVLRRLAGELGEIAELPVHRERARLWRKLNDLESQRPMVWINEIPWHEMNVDDELTLRTEHPWAQEQERNLRRTLYQWRHMPGDMIVSDFLACPLAVHSTDFGIIEDVDVVKTDEASDIVSRRFHIQIRDLPDLEKIRMPAVTHNEQATEYRYQAMCQAYEGILPVRKVGQTHIWFTPWDYLIRWWGVQEAMIDLIERPGLVHAAVDRMVEAWMVELDQFVDMNLLSLDCDNTRIGSGGYGYTRDLPGEDHDPDHVRPHNMWGCSNAQIFSEVSPEMHWEFAVRHDLRWLRRWGLTYYGCCEPLDRKMEILRRIGNLRKVSVSPWCDSERAVAEIGADYVISRKPNPAILAEDHWHGDRARRELVDFLEKAKGAGHVELIMKDISTVRREPQRLWEWADIAMQVAEEHAR